MKKIINLIISAILVLSASLTIFAQDQTALKQQLTNLKENAYKKSKNKTYRVKMTGESHRRSNDPKPNQFSSQIREYTPPDNSHIIYKLKTDQGILQEEKILIGQKEYIKQSDGSWREAPSRGNGIGGNFAVAGNPIENEVSVEYFYKGKKNINNQTADLYEVRTTRKYKTTNTESINTERYWFDQNGMFLRTENEGKINNKVTSSSISEYEYNLNIKIEAPKIN